ncbi:DUF4245 domain-containing protein [Arthrobacter sp. zg-Y1171]|uniref:DUF4245 domain-containing protein n=1 Tax=unclassified Arthrobacter TaxID=235627 RepID=UPI0021047C17|nr:DUF4245 domain-containing protein [Arthrobacter sp. zg-Y1171]MCQ1947790.1 DUF4245 domain-containing protein [Arthrobacter sp. zg-Y1116]MCQ1987733.1 DUF4245 domain-containing protein [Arthrobacter sp. zg-Y844]MCQ1996306.1 DUF4245 domain-containing protein [Arthrobacter sp. zg-Y1171]UWX82647.1 DUF4245 domain-containing protein [Arthrobacter sp. zg-Y1171]
MSETQPDPQQTDEPVTPVLTAKQAKRANATVIGMLIATGLTLALCLVPVLLNPAPKMQARNVDVAAAANQAAGDAGYQPLALELPDGWSANYARWNAGTNNGVPNWEVGYVTPDTEFISLTQTNAANPTWIYEHSGDSTVSGERPAGGVTWELRDSSNADSTLVAEIDGQTVILTGSADLAEFDVLADHVVRELRSN